MYEDNLFGGCQKAKQSKEKDEPLASRIPGRAGSLSHLSADGLYLQIRDSPRSPVYSLTLCIKLEGLRAPLGTFTKRSRKVIL